MILSTCCDAQILGDEVDPICSKCKEHCDTYNDEIEEKEAMNRNNMDGRAQGT